MCAGLAPLLVRWRRCEVRLPMQGLSAVPAVDSSGEYRLRRDAECAVRKSVRCAGRASSGVSSCDTGGEARSDAPCP